ncbi:MAG: aspartate aminotransferase family protein [Myxococcales bacterium]|nr:aspartate aminotransferase family protein [Myxococcales bacterium]MCB9531074.1 aspartate aminotransferase family protein [Myxococcales bacterium]MCB9532984.1 aspartate aminotransferase family protein [Myxococcales bacterium]
MTTVATDTLVALGRRTISMNYAPAPVVLERGQGARVWDTEGREYIDLLAGIAVSVVGHAHPRLVAALQDQVSKLLHVSNGFFTEPQVLLMEALTRLSFASRVYFGNSGAEANEAAIKLARRYQRVVRGTPRFEVISFVHGFHGRTYGALSATAQPKYHAGFEPMVPGFVPATFGDLGSVEARIGPHTAAILVEPVQGEGGVVPAPDGFLAGLRELCDRHGILLIFDEVQTGCGRTGRWFGYEHAGVAPDIMTLAKGIAGGVPLGVMLATEEVSAGFTRGSHASTFGGNPLATRAGLEVIRIVEEDGLVARGAELGERLRSGLSGLAGRFPIAAVRGLGAMTGAELAASPEQTAQVIAAARERGLLLNLAGSTVLRFVPPLVAADVDVDSGLERLEGALGSVFG